MEVIKTIYMPRGVNGMVFAVDGSGNVFKLLQNGKDWIVCAKKEFERYKTDSQNSWWNPVLNKWSSWRDLEKSLKEAGKELK